MSWLKITPLNSTMADRLIYIKPGSMPPRGYRFFATVLRPTGFIRDEFYASDPDNKFAKPITYGQPNEINQEFDCYVKIEGD